MKILGVDPGARRWGIAISDESGTWAFPRGVVPAGEALEAVARIAADEGVREIVVGLPRTLRGGAGPAARATDEAAGRIAARTGLPVRRLDERFTTAEADRAMREGGARRSRRRAGRDAVAAALLLQTYLARSAAPPPNR
jgi:putative Holliday junction resolvase